ncbi:MAG: hypothetical protein KDB14_19690 [Planctomycetales bacterium]|nr:hypothetical protein [Planctomycetales bacterium]
MSALLIGVLIATMVGCGRSGPSPDQLTQWVQAYHQQVDSMLALKSVEMGDAVAQDGGGFQVQFTVHESFAQDAFEPISLADAYRIYEHDPNLLDQTIQRAAKLRMPERAEAINSQPRVAPAAGQLFRRVARAGEDFSWQGKVIARQQADKSWDFSGLIGKPEHPAITPQMLTQDQLSTTSITVDTKDDTNRLTQAIAEQREFAKAVEQAEQRMVARLEQEHRDLLALITEREPLLANLPVANLPNARLSVHVCYQRDDGEEVVVLVEDTANPLMRACWQGALALPENANATLSSRPAAAHDGWEIRLKVVGENPFRNIGVNELMVLTATGPGMIRWEHQRQPVTLAKDPSAEKLPDYEQRVAQVLEWTRPGQSWEGTIQIGAQETHPIRVVFTEMQNEGGHVRLIVERPDEPFTVATFVGTVDTSPAAVYGWPVRVTHTFGKGAGSNAVGYRLPLIVEADHNLSLALTPAGDGHGVCYASAAGLQSLRLKLASGAKTLEPAPLRWRNALRPGDRWTGRIARAGHPDERIALTVSEVADEGRVYRFTMHNPDNLRQFRPFVGMLNESDKLIDGYAVAVRPISLTGEFTSFSSPDWNELYGTSLDARHWLRLHSDGKTLLMMSYEEELITLTKEATPAARSLDRAAQMERWRALCGQGNRWRGTLTKLKSNESAEVESAEVELAIASGLDGLGNVVLELSAAKMPKLRASFQGTLQLDDANVHAYALQLNKAAGSQSSSLLLGEELGRVKLCLRLAEDGKGLIGLGFREHELREFMTLQLISVGSGGR